MSENPRRVVRLNARTRAILLREHQRSRRGGLKPMSDLLPVGEDIVINEENAHSPPPPDTIADAAASVPLPSSNSSTPKPSPHSTTAAPSYLVEDAFALASPLHVERQSTPKTEEQTSGQAESTVPAQALSPHDDKDYSTVTPSYELKPDTTANHVETIDLAKLEYGDEGESNENTPHQAAAATMTTSPNLEEPTPAPAPVAFDSLDEARLISAIPEDDRSQDSSTSPESQDAAATATAATVSNESPSTRPTPEAITEQRPDESVSSAAANSQRSQSPAVSKSATATKLAIDESTEVLDWSGKGLRTVGVTGGWSAYPSITTLILSRNELTTIAKQGIETLPHLHTLDLRQNKLAGFGDTLLVLAQCRSLKHLFLHQSTRDNITANISLYTDFVFQSLRGLETCDGVVSSITISKDPHDTTAFEFIHLISGGMCENQLLRCDLSNKALPAYLFFFILSALYQLKIAWVKLDGNNEWSLLKNYSNCVIFYLGKYLLYLDENEITHQRLHLALKAQRESKVQLEKFKWEDIEEEAIETAREYVEMQNKLEEEMLEQKRYMDARALELAGASAAAILAAQQGVGNSNGGPDGIKASQDPHQTRKKQAQSEDDLGKEGEAGFNLHVPGQTSLMMGRNSSLPNAAVTSHNSSVGIDAQLSTKLEILIHYMQIFGLILLSSIGSLSWPQAFKDFSEWIRLFTLNIEKWFPHFYTFEQNILFFAVGFLPIILTFFFWCCSNLRGELHEWIRKYILEWKETRNKIIMLYGLFVSAGVLASMLFIGAQTYRGESPTSTNYTALMAFLLFPTLIIGIWWLLVRKFQKGYEKDTSVDKDVFRSEWLTKINWFQWLCLFCITNTFMPISRIILQQFQCVCVDETPGVDDNGLPTIIETPTNSYSGTKCYAAVDSSRGCFPSSYSAPQIIAVFLAALYLIGIPIFYYSLITNTVKVVLSTSRQYKLLGQEIQRLKHVLHRSKRLELSDSAEADRELIKMNLKEYTKMYHKLYYNIVNNPLNSVPASSLFAAYQSSFKYMKLFQMFEKVLLVSIIIFVPDSMGSELNKGAQLIWSSCIIGIYFLVLAYIRPYNDPLDDSMDILAEFANCVTTVMGLFLIFQVKSFTPNTVNIILLIANIFVLFAFLMAFIISPLKTYYYRRALKARIETEEAEEEQKMKAIIEGVYSRRQKNKASTNLNAVEDNEATLATTMAKEEVLQGGVGEYHLTPAVGETAGPQHIVRIHEDEEDESRRAAAALVSPAGSDEEGSVLHVMQASKQLDHMASLSRIRSMEKSEVRLEQYMQPQPSPPGGAGSHHARLDRFGSNSKMSGSYSHLYVLNNVAAEAAAGQSIEMQQQQPSHMRIGSMSSQGSVSQLHVQSQPTIIVTPQGESVASTSAGTNATTAGTDTAHIAMPPTSPLPLFQRGVSAASYMSSAAQSSSPGSQLPPLPPGQAHFRKSSISNTTPFPYGSPYASSATGSIPSYSRFHRPPSQAYHQRPHHRMLRPSLASLAELFGSSPSNLNTPAGSTDTEGNTTSMAENGGGRPRAASVDVAGQLEASSHDLYRTISGPSMYRVNSLGSPYDASPNQQSPPFNEGAAPPAFDKTPGGLSITSSNGDGSGPAPAQLTLLKVPSTEEEEFEAHFSRSSAEMSRMKQLALLKLCSPSSSGNATDVSSFEERKTGDQKPAATQSVLMMRQSLKDAINESEHEHHAAAGQAQATPLQQHQSPLDTDLEPQLYIAEVIPAAASSKNEV